MGKSVMQPVLKQTELDIDSLGWCRPVIEAAKDKMATDIYIVENKPARIGILKNYEIVEPIVKPTTQDMELFLDRTLSANMSDSFFLVGGGLVGSEDNAENNGNWFSSNNFEYGFTVRGFGRFRVSYTTSEEGRGMSIRKLPYQIPDFEELDKFQFLKGVRELLNFRSTPPAGLILHTGVTGSGKSTMIASEIDYIASRITGNVLIFENPIEYQITMRKANVRHYEVGRHIKSFMEGMKIALRNDPSVIMIGEVRTKDEIRTLFEVAAKGHLVFSTLHTSNVINTLKMLDELGGGDSAWRQMMAGNLRAVVSQKLLYRKDNFVLLAEAFIPNTEAMTLMSEGKFLEVKQMIDNNQLKDNGTIPFAESFKVLANNGYLTDRDKKEMAV